MNRCEWELSRLAAAMAQWQPQRTWREMRIADAAKVRYLGHAVQVPQQVLATPAVYASRFDDHLRAGYSWVNLNAAGVVDAILIVLVEVPEQPSGVPSERVAVNLSGPMAGVRVEIIDGWGRTMLAAAVVDAILQACDEWEARATEAPAMGRRLVRLTRRLLQLTANGEMPVSVANEVGQWCQQLQAAWEWWARTGDLRALGRSEGLVRVMKVWANELRINAEPGRCT